MTQQDYAGHTSVGHSSTANVNVDPLNCSSLKGDNSVVDPSMLRDTDGTNRDNACTHRDSSAAHRDNAGTHRDNAGTHRDNAGTHRESAGTHRDSAGTQIRTRDDEEMITNLVAKMVVDEREKQDLRDYNQRRTQTVAADVGDEGFGFGGDCLAADWYDQTSRRKQSRVRERSSKTNASLWGEGFLT